ncbi:MAG: hypothetical protein NTU43_09610 [Bacteroidetes bacterium]|nr:hypothetical protein [Bacteroidota bacterium]
MNTLQIDIINPKANKLLQDLADLKLISIRNKSDDSFLSLLNKFREKAKSNPPTLAEITKEVEFVRTKRYEK